MAASQSSRAADPFALRNLWLAGLGLAGIARRASGRVARGAIDGACRLRSDTVGLATDTRDVARGIALTIAERAQPLAAARIARAKGALNAVLAQAACLTPRRVPTEGRRRRQPVRKRKASAR
ncbi:hypothetical protein E2F46_06385 [Luteimonas aestuarii]|uniref:Uncharacterized protein n=1 Tax=Luteimonas aestuarii TaxID=453837 RepID=A0A4R5TYI2_9GAMM|nr:hypothetical protein [Luteimonas aestuarii]TDK26221.1 hypothetical protein E2F46_06385 [Luteimonas aestuarii]